jgi:hypothetical protein
MMAIEARNELARAASARYIRAGKKDKGSILSEFCANSGLSRKHALRLLLRPPEPAARRTRNRPRKYGLAEQDALRRLWPLLGHPSAKRTVAGLADLMDALDRHGEWVPGPKLRENLLAMSESSCERLLRPLRRIRPKGLSLTRAGKHLRSQIAVRRGTDWDDATPGFLEGDLVEHCGGDPSGSFLYTLTLTDVALGWTEFVPLKGKGQLEAVAGLELAGRRMPIPPVGVDFDNGSEFINHHMKAYCEKRSLKLTRGRPYVKNDGCRVEQKNGAIVRKHAGYGRLEGEEHHCLLAELYGIVRLLVNFFEPSAKLLRYDSRDGKSRKVYDAPKTPYRRALESASVPEPVKAKLTAKFETLNPVALRNQLRLVKRDLLEPELVRFLDEASEQFGCDP